jgi:Fe-S cluster biogenesis protein NfuA
MSPPRPLPQSTPTPGLRPSGPLADRVAKVINLIRPAVQSDGGDLELVDVTPEGIVRIRLHGACVGCPSSSITLQVGIERNLKAHIPEVTSVQAVA